MKGSVGSGVEDLLWHFGLLEDVLGFRLLGAVFEVFSSRW